MVCMFNIKLKCMTRAKQFAWNIFVQWPFSAFPKKFFFSNELDLANMCVCLRVFDFFVGNPIN